MLFRLSNNAFIQIEPGCWFFRILGFGLHWMNYEKWPPLFSERHGLVRVVKIGSGRLKVLWKRAI